MGPVDDLFTSADVLDDSHELIDAVAVLAREADELTRSRNHRSSLRAAGHRDAAAAAELQQSLISEQAQSTQNSVRVHVKNSGEVASRRQPFAWVGLSLGDRAPDLGCDLHVELGRLSAVNLDVHDCASDTSTMPPLLLPSGITGLREAPASHDPNAELEALIEEARARQRRRRLRATLALLGVAAVAAVAYGLDRALDGAAPAASHGRGPFVDARAFAGHGRLAFVSRGSLFVLDGATRKLIAVTGPHADALDPQFSPDGRWLLYSLGEGFGLARADGVDPHLYRGGAEWLPDGKLLAGRRILRVAADGSLVAVGHAPKAYVATASDGSRYAFVVDRIVQGRNGSFHGVELLEVADSLTGPRAVWYRLPITFTRSSGYQGSGIAGVVVLPQNRGLLLRIDPVSHANALAADGLPLYELTAPGQRPRKLAITVGGNVSLGHGSEVAVGAGPNRYAWLSKTAETCSLTTARCSAVSAPAGQLTLDPAWSPDGGMLAFVAAAPGKESDFRQATIERWYATHRLWLLRAGASRPIEVPGTEGAAVPAWSQDGRSILFVRDDGLWLIPRLGAKPVEVASPFFGPQHWPSYYGQIGWTLQFAWWSGS